MPTLRDCALGSVLMFALQVQAADTAKISIQIEVDWSRPIAVSKTTPTVMVVPNPIIRKASPVRDAAFAALKELQSDYPRYLAWLAYPRLAVPALEPPTREKTSWDFSQVDSVMIPFLESTKGRAPIISFSTIPAWMFKTPKRVRYGDDPDKIDFAYGAGTELVDPTGKQLGDYHARLMRWYTQGGFTDELGKKFHSGHRYDLPWWGVLNEIEIEHLTTPQEYTRRYDAIVSAVKEVNPKTKFMALSLCGVRCDVDEGPKFFEYFLDPKNHRPGIPIDMISYHFYAHLREAGSVAEWQFNLFDQAESFVNSVQYIDTIRKRLRPDAKVNIDELGLRLIPEDRDARKPIPKIYWNMGAAYDVYLYVELAKRGVDVLTVSHFIGADDFTPSESMINWHTGQPNARYHAQKLLNQHFSHGDTFVATTAIGPMTRRIKDMMQLPEPPEVELFTTKEVTVQAIRTAKGNRILLVNKTASAVDVDLTNVGGRIVRADIVDEESGDSPARRETTISTGMRLAPFALAVLNVE